MTGRLHSLTPPPLSPDPRLNRAQFPEEPFELFKAATRGAPKRAHEIVQFQERERLFQNRRRSDKRELLFGILLTQSIHKFGTPGA